jgi:uncharacterized protein YfaS (alpha-2-macroglobulin family)
LRKALPGYHFYDTLQGSLKGGSFMSKLFLFALVVLSPVAVFAQSTFGTVLGTVTDNSGAVVPKAKVSLTDTDENTSRATLTDAKGEYEFVNTIVVPGFQTRQ